MASKHSNTAQHPTKNCLHCGTPFPVNPSLTYTRRKRFCSPLCGKLARVKPLAERFWAKVRKTEGCWLWLGGGDKDGYGQIYSGIRSEGYIKASRASYEIHFGPSDRSLKVLHRCDNPPCVRPDHLFLGTIAENNEDRDRKGRTRGTFKGGERHPNSKLTDDDVREIRDRQQRGEALRSIAKSFRLNPATVSKVVHRVSWSHLE